MIDVNILLAFVGRWEATAGFVCLFWQAVYVVLFSYEMALAIQIPVVFPPPYLGGVLFLPHSLNNHEVPTPPHTRFFRHFVSGNSFLPCDASR